ncbi:MAG TPA: hypothetical protein VFL14_14810 [Xanthomonadales bacterium]|nr:hypothetical protein [Xanthomonadales bacterium]
MPEQIAIRPAAAISLAELVETLDHTIVPDSTDALRRAAPALAAFAANRTALADWLVDALSRMRGFQAGNDYNFQSFVLVAREKYLLRANIWLPLAHVQRLSESQAYAAGYGLAHNHNFHLLTVGYHGAGYRTDVYRIAGEYPEAIGDAVELRSFGKWQLGTGSLFLYDGYVDVHTQLPPDELSVSINVMTRAGDDELPQFTFDPAAGRTVGMVGSPTDRRVQLLAMARLMGSEAAQSALEATSASHPSTRQRKLAAQALEGRSVAFR